MKTSKMRLLAALAPLAVLGLSACTTGFQANVSRFQQMPVSNGQSFTVQTENPKLAGGLEFAQYAALVAQQLEAKGYKTSASPQGAALVVNLDYGVDNGQQKVVSRPGVYSHYNRFWYGPWRHPYYWGWDDPFWYSPFGAPEVDSYTVYTSYLKVDIARTADGQKLFEGKAKARSSDDSLPRLVPNLIAAMFTDFPGRSGEEIKITVPPERR